MTLNGKLVSTDSHTLRVGSGEVLLEAVDGRGRRIRGQLVRSDLPGEFVFEAGSDWRSVYRSFEPDSFVVEFYVRRNGTWESYLLTKHSRP